MLRIKQSIMKHLTVGLLAFVVLMLSFNSAMALDWEWTEGQGWSQATGIPKETPTKQLNFAYGYEKNGQYLPAAKEYFLLLQEYPDSEEASVALQRLAGCLFFMENYYTSFKALEQVMKSYGRLTRNKAALIDIEFQIGEKFQNGARVNPIDSNEPQSRRLEAAAEVYKAVVANDPYGPRAGPALLALGDVYRKLDQPETARTHYNRVINEFGASTSLVAAARLGLQECDVKLGEANAGDVKDKIREYKVELAKEGLDTPEEREDYNKLDERERELMEAAAEEKLRQAQYYNNRGTHKSRSSAKFLCEQVMEEYPNTEAAVYAQKMHASIVVPPEKFNGWRIPFLSKKDKEKTLDIPGRTSDFVPTDAVYIPAPIGDSLPEEAISVAGPRPDAPARPVRRTPRPAIAPPPAVSTPAPQPPAATTTAAAPPVGGTSLSPRSRPVQPPVVPTQNPVPVERTYPKKPRGRGASVMPAMYGRETVDEAGDQ